MSTRPKAWWAVAMRPAQPSAVVMSLPLARAVPPAAVISATTSSAGPGEAPEPSLAQPRSLTTTLAPRAASSRAYSRPTPRPAPVTTATRPSKRSSLTVLLLLALGEGFPGLVGVAVLPHLVDEPAAELEQEVVLVVVPATAHQLAIGVGQHRHPVVLGGHRAGREAQPV